MKKTTYFLVMVALLFSFNTIAQVDFDVDPFVNDASGTDVYFIDLDTTNETLEIYQGDTPAETSEFYGFDSNTSTWNTIESLDFNSRVDGRSETYDFDGDGDLDIAIISRFGGLKVFQNNGDSGFTLKYTDPHLYKTGAIAPFDRNNDGIEEMYFTGNIATSGVNLNNGFLEYDSSSGTISSVSAPGIPPTHFGSIASGNVAGGAGKDLIIVAALADGSNYGAVLENNEDNTVTEVFTFEGRALSRIDITDIGGTSLMDFGVLGAGSGGAKTILYENIGSGNFTQHLSATTNLPDLFNGGLRFADIDNDGLVDCWIAGENGADYTGLHLGTGSFVFNSAPIIFDDPMTGNPIALEDSSVDIGDYDQDNDLDLIVNGTNVSDQKKTYVFTQQIPCTPIEYFPDVDGDGIGDDSQPSEMHCPGDEPPGWVTTSGDNCPATANSDQANNDNDSEGDACDEDDDNDGTPDTEDAFPLDPNEDTDTDSDGIGDNADPDDDNDGTPDDEDAFPLDSSEDTDTDSDGIGDNADTDDDNDGNPDTTDPNPTMVVTMPDTLVVIAGDPDGTVNALENDDFIADPGVVVLQITGGTISGSFDIDGSTGEVTYTPTEAEKMEPGGSQLVMEYQVTNTAVTPEVSSTNVINVTVEEVLSTDTFDISNDIQLYPNPTTSEVTVQIPETFLNTTIEVTNLLGQTLIQTRDLTIDVNRFSKGVYFIKVISEQGIGVKQLVVR